MSDHLDEELHGCLQYHWAAVRNLLENELGKDTSHIVTPGGKVHDNVLERVESGPWVGGVGVGRGGRGWERVGERKERKERRKRLHWMCTELQVRKAGGGSLDQLMINVDGKSRQQQQEVLAQHALWHDTRDRSNTCFQEVHLWLDTTVRVCMCEGVHVRVCMSV